MGGSSESAAKAWHVNPTGAPSSNAVTMVIPVAKWPSTSRNRAWSRPVMSAARPSTVPGALRLAEVDRLCLVRRGHVLDQLRLRQPARPIQNAVELAIGVRRVVV